MIVHIFTGERYHLVPGIAKGFITTYANDARHRILLFGSKEMDRNRYDRMFKELGYTNYSFCTSRNELISQIWKNRKNTILTHGEWSFYIILLFSFIFACASVNWICWGAASKISHGGKSFFFNPLKRYLYNRLHTIVTLMEDDRRSIIKDFNYPSNKIRTIAYASEGEMSAISSICAKLRLEQNVLSNKVKVLVGNNPGNIPYYNRIIDLLSPFKGKIELHCMMNYSLVKNKQYEDFIVHGKSVFGDDFYSDEDFFSTPESYSRYMNMYDIYLCGNPNQTGLGALYTMLLLGKKIYVTGKNYTWLKDGIGSVIYDISTISEFEDFINPLTNDEKDNNYQQITDYKIQTPNKWHNYLKEIDR